MEWVGCIIQLDFPTSKINGQRRDHCCQPQVSLNFASSYNHYIETHALSFVDWPVLFQPAVVYSLYITGTGSCINAVSLLVSRCIVQGAECITAVETNSIYTELQIVALIFRSLKMQQTSSYHHHQHHAISMNCFDMFGVWTAEKWIPLLDSHQLAVMIADKIVIILVHHYTTTIVQIVMENIFKMTAEKTELNPCFLSLHIVIVNLILESTIKQLMIK